MLISFSKPFLLFLVHTTLKTKKTRKKVRVILCEMEGECFPLLFPSISHCFLLLKQLHQGKPLWSGMGSTQAETPILGNCSEMCLCRGSRGNKLATNIITVLVEWWKFYTETERGGERQWVRGKDVQGEMKIWAVGDYFWIDADAALFVRVHTEGHFTWSVIFTSALLQYHIQWIYSGCGNIYEAG